MPAGLRQETLVPDSECENNPLRELSVSDDLAELIERRVADMEEVLAAPWPRRLVLARRLRRSLRASVRGYEGWAGDFFAQRAEAVMCRWLKHRADT
jgi:hypothetical protein